MLKKDVDFYTKALESHEPFCTLKASDSSSTIYLSFSPSADSQTGSNPLQASSSSPATTSSLSTPSTSTLDPQTLESVESSLIPLSVPALTATLLDSVTVSSTQLFPPSCSKAVPNSVTFPMLPSPHSLFCKTPPSLITSRLTKASPICTSPISSPVNSSSVTTPVHPKPGQGSIHESPSLSANACFSTQPHFAPSAFQMKQASFQSPFSNAVPTYSHFVSENTGQASQECPMNLPQLYQGNVKTNPGLANSLSVSALADPALQYLTVSPRESQEPPAASTFASVLSDSQHVTPNPVPLLSQLTNPSPLAAPQTTSLSLEGQLLEFSLQHVGASSMDPSLTELLEVDDWILQ